MTVGGCVRCGLWVYPGQYVKFPKSLGGHLLGPYCLTCAELARAEIPLDEARDDPPKPKGGMMKYDKLRKVLETMWEKANERNQSVYEDGYVDGLGCALNALDELDEPTLMEEE